MIMQIIIVIVIAGLLIGFLIKYQEPINTGLANLGKVWRGEFQEMLYQNREEILNKITSNPEIISRAIEKVKAENIADIAVSRTIERILGNRELIRFLVSRSEYFQSIEEGINSNTVEIEHLSELVADLLTDLHNGEEREREKETTAEDVDEIAQEDSLKETGINNTDTDKTSTTKFFKVEKFDEIEPLEPDPKPNDEKRFEIVEEEKTSDDLLAVENLLKEAVNAILNAKCIRDVCNIGSDKVIVHIGETLQTEEFVKEIVKDFFAKGNGMGGVQLLVESFESLPAEISVISKEKPTKKPAGRPRKIVGDPPK